MPPTGLDPEADKLDSIIDKFGTTFPKTAEFSDLARLSLPEVHAEDDPDAALIDWLDHEEALFRRLERRVVSSRIEAGFVNEEAVVDRGWIHLIAESSKAIAGEPINIVQHPGGERQQIAIRENRIIGPDDDFLIYTTDTKRGLSGSPALNDQWQLAALHHAGVPEEDAAGNWLRKDGGVYLSLHVRLWPKMRSTTLACFPD